MSETPDPATIPGLNVKVRVADPQPALPTPPVAGEGACRCSQCQALDIGYLRGLAEGAKRVEELATIINGKHDRDSVLAVLTWLAVHANERIGEPGKGLHRSHLEALLGRLSALTTQLDAAKARVEELIVELEKQADEAQWMFQRLPPPDKRKALVRAGISEERQDAAFERVKAMLDRARTALGPQA